MVHQIKSFLNFYINSKNRHGVHSPFVYKLITECFNDGKDYLDYSVLKKYRKTLLKDKSQINITDFGEGSHVFKGNLRKISAIAKNAGMTSKRQRLLYRLVIFLKCENILELGTSLGLGTAALAIATKTGNVTTVDGCEETLEKAKCYFSQFDIKNIITERNTFSEFLSDNTKKYDFIFIDGDHNGRRTLIYFDSLLKDIHNNSVMVFDDIYWSREMTQAWKKIISDPMVTVSIDTFQWGIVFFRKAQAKQHFLVRVC